MRPRTTATLTATTALIATTALTPTTTIAAAPALGNGPSTWPTISANGRYIAFTSTATNLTPDDYAGKADIFLRDTLTGRTTLVSGNYAGENGNGGSYYPSVSDNGTLIAFATDATNLIPGDPDTNNSRDIYRYNAVDGAMTRVSQTLKGTRANGASGNARISGDGQVVAYTSAATNLTPGDTNNKIDAFVRGYTANTLTLASKNPNGTQSTRDVTQLTLSPNGRRAGWMWSYGTAAEWARGTTRTTPVYDPNYGGDPLSVVANNNHVGALSEGNNAFTLALNGATSTHSLYWFYCIAQAHDWDQTPDGLTDVVAYWNGDDNKDYIEVNGPNGYHILTSKGRHPVISNDATTVAFDLNGQVYKWTLKTGTVTPVSVAK